MDEPIKKGIYRHFKGECYEVTGEGFDSETNTAMVIYRNVNDEKIWIRPKNMFLDMVDYDGKKQIRFKFIR